MDDEKVEGTTLTPHVIPVTHYEWVDIDAEERYIECMRAIAEIRCKAETDCEPWFKLAMRLRDYGAQQHIVLTDIGCLKPGLRSPTPST